MLTHVPLASHIRQQLEQEPSDTSPEKLFLELLEEVLKEDEAKQGFEVAIESGSYGKVYEYDVHAGRLALPDQEEG